MNCRYCNSETEKGRIKVSGAGILGGCIEWYEEKEFAKTGFLKLLKPSFIITNATDGYYKDAYYCPQCQKLFAEFPTK